MAQEDIGSIFAPGGGVRQPREFVGSPGMQTTQTAGPDMGAGLTQAGSSVAMANPYAGAALMAAGTAASIIGGRNAQKRAKNQQRARDTALEDIDQRREASYRAFMQGLLGTLDQTLAKTGRTGNFAALYSTDPRAGTSSHLMAYDPKFDKAGPITDSEFLLRNNIDKEIRKDAAAAERAAADTQKAAAEAAAAQAAAQEQQSTIYSGDVEGGDRIINLIPRKLY